MRVTVTYDEVKSTAERKGKCRHCGRQTTRRRTFTMTVSPFNKNQDGTVRTYAEVQEAVHVLASKWEPEPEVFEHGKCWERNRDRIVDDSVSALPGN